jgi:hypothetical protein
MPHIIKEMFAFVAVDSSDGDEGLAAFMRGETLMPMVGSDLTRVDSLRPMAQLIADHTGQPVTLVRFTVRETLDVIEPAGGARQP